MKDKIFHFANRKNHIQLFDSLKTFTKFHSKSFVKYSSLQYCHVSRSFVFCFGCSFSRFPPIFFEISVFLYKMKINSHSRLSKSNLQTKYNTFLYFSASEASKRKNCRRLDGTAETVQIDDKTRKDYQQKVSFFCSFISLDCLWRNSIVAQERGAPVVLIETLIISEAFRCVEGLFYGFSENKASITFWKLSNVLSRFRARLHFLLFRSTVLKPNFDLVIAKPEAFC